VFSLEMRGLQERGRSSEDTVRTAGLAVCDGMLQVIVMIGGCLKGRGIVVARALQNKVLLGLGAMGMGIERRPGHLQLSSSAVIPVKAGTHFALVPGRQVVK
jgi:hypothetical protein